MHRLPLGLFALCALVALEAAAPADTRPTVVVYPLQASASLPRDITLRIVTALSNEIALNGQVHVITADPDTDRTTFLTAARKAGADFYVTGFLTPLGDSASLIEQLVSTHSGAVVANSSGTINNLVDVNSQGDMMRQAIIARSNPTYPALAPEANDNTPPPAHATANGSSTAIGGLFHHKKGEEAPSPSPSPAPAASPTP